MRLMLTDLGITSAASLTAKVVEPFDLVHEEVDNSNDDSHT